MTEYSPEIRKQEPSNPDTVLGYDNLGNPEFTSKASLGGGGGSGGVLLGSVTASNYASVEFVDGVSGIVLDNTYSKYIIEILDLVPQTNSVVLWLRTGASGVFSTGGTDYAFRWARLSSGDSGNQSGGNDSKIEIGGSLSNAAGDSLSGRVEIWNPSDTTYTTKVIMETINDSVAAESRYQYGGGLRNAAVAVDSLQILCSSGNIASGIFNLYGVA